MARKLQESPSQTAGPYVHIGCTPRVTGIELYARDLGVKVWPDDAPGEPITIGGYIFDGAGAPLLDGMIEIWQADVEGRFGPDGGWGRAATDEETGLYRFETVKPGSVVWHDGQPQAPHLTVWIVARGINLGLHTRMYFADERHANADDPILSQIDPTRRDTLMARQTGGIYRFDIRLQGSDETVFFDI